MHIGDHVLYLEPLWLAKNYGAVLYFAEHAAKRQRLVSLAAHENNCCSSASRYNCVI